MDSRLETGPTALDTAKLFLACLILVGGIFAYYFYTDVSVLWRAIGVLVAFLAALGVVMTTYHGHLLSQFIQGSRIELRKVVWPSREETMQTTAIVLVFALIGGVFFWLLDLFLLTIRQYIVG
jgi:preprotein translocase subunit SecE